MLLTSNVKVLSPVQSKLAPTTSSFSLSESISCWNEWHWKIEGLDFACSKACFKCHYCGVKLKLILPTQLHNNSKGVVSNVEFNSVTPNSKYIAKYIQEKVTGSPNTLIFSLFLPFPATFPLLETSLPWAALVRLFKCAVQSSSVPR